MTRLSQAALMAWNIAMLEALNAGSGYLEKEHLIIGLYSLEKALSLQNPTRDPEALKKIIEEKDALNFPLCNSGLDAATLRRNIRKTLPHDKPAGERKVVHRSPDCRSYFARAETLANAKEITCVHLLSAILENPGPKILGVVDKGSVHNLEVGANPVSMQMTQALLEFRKKKDNENHILDDIGAFRQTLITVPRDSDRYSRLKRELNKKTIQLAFVCLDLKETAQLINSLNLLSHEYSAFQSELTGIIQQLEYIRKEGIGIGNRSSDLIRSVLQKLERETGDEVIE